MMKNIINAQVLSPLCCLFWLWASMALAQPASYWGIQFPTSQSGAAQQHFLEAVTAMHLHMFEDAEAHFQAAQEIAPDFAMAYWGEALSNHRTVWNIHRLNEARAVLNKLAPTPAARADRAPTQREKDYLGAIELLFGEGGQRERQQAYSEAMSQLSAEYPDDMEAKAWYALSLMRVTPPDRTREQTRSLMASLSLEVLANNPRHPGANRYLIQSTDDPENTDIGIIAVNNLQRLDVESAEALHIPSHYYIQHGMWRETAESNIRAFESSMAWVKAHDWKLQQLNNHNYGHLLQFANYGFLQSGQLSEAEKIRERVLQDYIASGKAEELAATVADVFARHVIDLERWSLAEELAELARAHDLNHANVWTAVGIAAARSDQLSLAREALEVLSNYPSQATATEWSIGARQVEGSIKLAEGNVSQSLESLRQAIETNKAMNRERPVTLIGMPPRPIKPSYELYGETLLSAGNAGAALNAFQTGLTTYRGRTNLLMGAIDAAMELVDEAAERRYRQLLNDIWIGADATHPFAEIFLGRVAATP